jgi:hypothetical protein
MRYVQPQLIATSAASAIQGAKGMHPHDAGSDQPTNNAGYEADE